MTEAEIEKFDVFTDLENNRGCIVECDLEYPEHLHESHSNLPLAPEMLEVGYNNLSPYAKKTIWETDRKETYKDVKLMTTFHKREKYVVHHLNLRLYVQLGMVLTKIHRVLAFDQDKIIAPYIEMTTAARQNAASKFEMDMFKKLVRFSQNKDFFISVRNLIPG